MRSTKPGVVSELNGNGRKINVAELAKKLSCHAKELYREIEEEKLAEWDGIYQVFPGKRGIRVDEWLFLHRRLTRLTPPSLTGDEWLRDAHRAFLAFAKPLRTVLDRFIEESEGQYEKASIRLENRAFEQELKAEKEAAK
jgi:hypothetical protein